MTSIDDYQNSYRNIAFSRTDGVLECKLHTEGGPLLWGAQPDSIHAQLGPAFADIARDQANRVVILTGTGISFCEAMNPAEMPAANEDGKWSRLMREGREMLMNLMNIEVPVIAAVNGPALIHAELAVLADIVLASDSAVFADQAHMSHGVVPGDGVQTVWPMLLGVNRARYFLLTGQQIDARQALAFGVVNEVLPVDALLERARALAAELAAKPLVVLRNTRAVLTQDIKRRLHDELAYGLALEGFATLSGPS